jgi:hypothetical protein
MGIFSLFSAKKPIEEIVTDYTRAYNKVIYANGTSVEGFIQLAEYSFDEAIRLNRTSCTIKKESYGWFGFEIKALSGSHNVDRKKIAGYIQNAIAMAQKHFWEPVSQQKINLLESLIEANLIGKISNATIKFKNEIELTCQKFNDAMIWEKKNAIEALTSALEFAYEEGFSDSSKEIIEISMKSYAEKINTVLQYSPSEAGIRKVIVDSVAHYIFEYFYESLQSEDVEIDDIKIIAESRIFH